MRNRTKDICSLLSSACKVTGPSCQFQVGAKWQMLLVYLLHQPFHIPLCVCQWVWVWVSDLNKILFLNLVSSDSTTWGFFNLSCLTWEQHALCLPVTKEEKQQSSCDCFISPHWRGTERTSLCDWTVKHFEWKNIDPILWTHSAHTGHCGKVVLIK